MGVISFIVFIVFVVVELQKEVEETLQNFYPGKTIGRIYKSVASKSLNMTRYLHCSISLFITATGQRH